MLFGYHGKSYKLGDITEHIPASDDSPAADLNMSVYWLEPEKGLFCIDVERIVTIDKSDVKQFMGALFSTFGKGEERQSDKFKDVMGELGDMKITFFRRAEMFDDGWPSMVIDQTKEVFEGGRQGEANPRLYDTIAHSSPVYPSLCVQPLPQCPFCWRHDGNEDLYICINKQNL